MEQAAAAAEKAAIRRWVWDELTRTGQAAFPRPVHGRIPNFVGSARAAQQLFQQPEYQRARALKVGPDAPLHPVRAQALRDGKVVYMPAPRLRGEFVVLEPGRIPPGHERAASSLTQCLRYGRPVPVTEIGPVDLIVTGSVAVARDGARVGKGEGYGDLEYALLRLLGHPDVPVATVVHSLQVVERVPWSPHDLSVDLIATPEGVLRTGRTYPQPATIDWEALGERLAEMPVLVEVRRRLHGSERPS